MQDGWRRRFRGYGAGKQAQRRLNRYETSNEERAALGPELEQGS